MTLTITSDKLIEKVKSFSFKNDGDFNEREYGSIIVDIFKNNELFWQYFVTPMTNRVDDNVVLQIDKTDPRKGIDNSIKDFVAIHYSAYLNLTYAADCLKFNRQSAFENFYTNLGSVCDLTEEFLTQVYFLKLECSGAKSETLQYLSKRKFLDIAADWYEKYYPSTYTHYLNKGKHAPVKLLSRTNILDEYFGTSAEWKTYKTFANSVRSYRNVIVHNSQIGSILHEHNRYVPKKEKIQNYKKWHEVFAAKEERFKYDFIKEGDLMNEDFVLMKKYLNDIWTKPHADMYQLLYVDKNQTLLTKYALKLD